MKVQDFYKASDLSERVTNYIQEAKSIAELYGYEDSPLSQRISHGLQKDAIQNGWDAREKDTRTFLRDNWKFEFELSALSNGKTILMMTDHGTVGLTGDLTSDDLKSGDISADELPENERWARWEAHGFAKLEGLGARGWGKMLYMVASKEYTIYYDSVRSDGTYKFGGSTATMSGCPILRHEGEEAKEFIKSNFGIDPLSHQGTRVIIMDPVDEVIEDINNGNFVRFIEETWWPNILKNGVEITVKCNGKKTKAQVPDLFPITKETSESDTFKTWVKDEDDFKKKHAGLKIKRLCVACDKEEEAGELYQGIACFREGMKVEVVKFPAKALKNKVYGYIEFDKNMEEELREIEKPTHYAFQGPLWRKLKQVIIEELEAFGNKKLGLTIDSQALANKRRTSAESKALIVLRALTKNWPISRWSKGSGGGGNGGNGPYKTIGVRLSKLAFPNPGNVPRLDYGEKLEGFEIVVFNRTGTALDVTLDAFVLSGDRRILNIEKQSFCLEQKSDVNFSGYSIVIQKGLFKDPGVYRIHLILKDKSTNSQIDQIKRRFWVQMDPELTGPFNIRRLNFAEIPDEAEIDKSREWFLHDEGTGIHTLFYNVGHPAYLHNDESDMQLATYLSELFLLGAIELFIKQSLTSTEEISEDKEKPLNLEVIRTAEPLRVYQEHILAFSKIRERMYGLL